MAELATCPTCGATDQEVGKFCEQCGGKVEVVTPPVTPDDSAPVSSSDTPLSAGDMPAQAIDTAAATPPTTAPAAAGMMRFVRLENGVPNDGQTFDVPVGSELLVG